MPVFFRPTNVSCFAAVALLLLAAALPAKADNSWIGQSGSTGDWTTAINWLVPLPPLQTDNVTIANGGTARIANATALARNLYLGATGTSGSLRIESGTLSMSTNAGTGIFIGSGLASRALLLQTGGEVRAATGQVRILSIGTGTDSVATYDHRGGTLAVQSLRIGSPSGIGAGTNVTGTYVLSGSGSLTASGVAYIGKAGSSGAFEMTGGSASVFEMYVQNGGTLNISGGRFSTTTRALNVDAGGDVVLSSGTLDTSTSVLTANMAGDFMQTGGSHISAPLSVSGSYGLSGGSLSIAGSAGLSVSGTLALQGAGTLTTTKLTQSAGLFHHVSSRYETGILAINGGTYRMSSGTLAIGTSWTLGSSATFDFDGGNGAVTVAPDATVNLSGGSIVNAGNASLTIMGSETLVILPSGFSPQVAFGSFLNEGTTYSVGSTLDVLAGRTLKLSGNFSDPVQVSGTLQAAAGTSLSLTNGLALQPGGVVSLGIAGGVSYGSGIYSMAGGSLTTRDFNLAYSGTTAFSQSGGSAQVTNISIGTGTDSVATYDHRGGTLAVQSLRIGSPSGIGAGTNVTGTYVLSGSGSLTASGVAYIGKAGSSGAFEMTGGSASVFEMYVQNGGTLNISGGRFSTTTRALNVDAGGDVVLSSGTLDTSTSVLTANMAGDFMQTGGSHISAPLSVSGSYGLSGGSLSIAGSAGLSVSGTLALQGAGTLTTTKLTQSAGLFHHVSSRYETGILAINGGTYRMSSGTLAIGTSWTLGSSATFDFDGGNGAVTVAPDATVNLSGGSIVNAGNASLTIMGTNSLAIFPSGVRPDSLFGTFLNEGTTYTVGSPLIVQNGRLINLTGEIQDPIDTAGTIRVADSLIVMSELSVQETGLVAGEGTVTVRGGTMRGKGRVETDVVLENAVIAPGLSPGVLTIEGNWIMDASSQLQLEITGSVSGSYDRLVVAGASTLNGTLAAFLNTELSLGTGFLVLDNQSSQPLHGGFGPSITASYNSQLYTFDINYAAGDGNDMSLLLVNITAVPEPSTYVMALAGLACGGYSLFRRRRAC